MDQNRKKSRVVTRQEMVLEIYDREAMGEVTESEIRIIQSGLIAEFGEGGGLSPAEIARVLLEEKLPVRLHEVFRMGDPRDAYEECFAGLAFAESLGQAEEALRLIAARHCEFLAQGDRTGVRYARQTAMRARQNALARAAQPGATANQRLIQQEIARWFSVWLQTPDIFPIWLELRKRQPELRELLDRPS
ncbi:MAG: hypothetical protein ACOYLF_09590 [Blastocatellia bacterium]